MESKRMMKLVSAIYAIPMNWTNLHFAVFIQNMSEIDQLMDKGADIDARNYDEETPLHIACLGNSDCIEGILKYNPSMNVAEKIKGITPLIRLVRFSCHRTSTLRIMLEMGADPNLSQTDGNTPLHIIARAVDAKKQKALKYAVELMKFKANVGAQNNHGDTPLHIAILTGFTEFVRILLKNGVNLKIRNRYEKCPIEYAIENRIRYHEIFIEIGEYVMKQTSIGKLVVTQKILNRLLLFDNLKHFKEKCEQEVLKLKSSVTDRTSVTFYDFLVLPLDVVRKYLQNEDTLESVMALDQSNYIFGSRLSKIFRNALSRNQAIDMGYEFFSRFSPVILPDLCMDVICEYLTEEDLQKLKKLIN